MTTNPVFVVSDLQRAIDFYVGKPGSLDPLLGVLTEQHVHGSRTVHSGDQDAFDVGGLARP